MELGSFLDIATMRSMLQEQCALVGQTLSSNHSTSNIGNFIRKFHKILKQGNQFGKMTDVQHFDFLRKDLDLTKIQVLTLCTSNERS